MRVNMHALRSGKPRVRGGVLDSGPRRYRGSPSPATLRRRLTMAGSVIVSGARTPIGKLSGSLKGFSAVDLGGVAVKAALDKAGISGDQVDYVILGQVLQAGAGQITARQAAVKGGIPMT